MAKITIKIEKEIPDAYLGNGGYSSELEFVIANEFLNFGGYNRNTLLQKMANAKSIEEFSEIFQILEKAHVQAKSFIPELDQYYR